MLVNRIPCLDAGFVAYLDSSGNSNKLKDIALEFFKKTDGKFLHDISTLTLVIKCPLFVQLNLSRYALHIISTLESEVEAYVPNVGEIGGKDHETNRLISDDIKRTTEALLINPRAYQTDGCDRFVSQILMPVSTYTTLIIHGSCNEWRKFCTQNNTPASISSYIDAVKQIMTLEWK